MKRFPSFTPVMLKRGNVVHAITLYAPKKTACGKRASSVRVHPARVLDCIECLAALFYPVTVEAMKRWLDRNRYRVPVSAVKEVAKRKRR